MSCLNIPILVMTISVGVYAFRINRPVWLPLEVTMIGVPMFFALHYLVFPQTRVSWLDYLFDLPAILLLAVNTGIYWKRVRYWYALQRDGVAAAVTQSRVRHQYRGLVVDYEYGTGQRGITAFDPIFLKAPKQVLMLPDNPRIHSILEGGGTATQSWESGPGFQDAMQWNVPASAGADCKPAEHVSGMRLAEGSGAHAGSLSNREGAIPKGRKILLSILGAAFLAVTISFTMGLLLAKTPESLLKGALCISIIIFVIAFPVFLLLLGVFGRGKVSRPAPPAQRAEAPAAMKPAENSLWVQSADFSARNFPFVSAEESIRVYRTQDWARELDRMQALQAQGQDCCPPGMGLVGADGRLLHICPDGNGQAAVLYRPAGTPLGAAITFHELPESDVPTAIAVFHAGDEGWLRDHLRD